VPRLPRAANPELDAALRAHDALLMEGGCVPALTKELCAAMVAGLTFCHPLLVAHRGRARKLGADAQMLNDLWDYTRSDRYTAAQKAALAAAVALTREPRALPDPVWAQLREHFDDAQIVELLCAIGFSNYLDRVSNALQTEIERATPD